MIHTKAEIEKRRARRIFPVFACFAALLLACVFASCEKEPDGGEDGRKIATLVAPGNLRVSESVIYWDVVENATEYTVQISGNDYTVKENYFDAFEYFTREQDYVVRVCAKNGEVPPMWSDALVYQMRSDVEWEYVPYRTGYRVSVARDKNPHGIALIPSVHPEDGKPISDISVYSFLNCTEITGVIFPADTKKMSIVGFKGCTGLQKIILPEQAEGIFTEAFRDCISLSFVKMPKECRLIGAQAFAGCASLKHIELPEGIKEIKSQAFEDCTALEAVIIPKTVTTIWAGAFSGCNAMRSMTVAQGNPRYRSEKNCVIDRSINAVIFGNRHSTIPAGVAGIAEEAFAKSEGLTEITIPSSVTTIFNGAFYRCTDLRSVTFGENLKNIGGSNSTFHIEYYSKYTVFAECLLLTELNLPASFTGVKSGTFEAIPNLEKITVSPENPVFCAEGNCLITKADKTAVFGTKNAVIPEWVEAVGYCFYRHIHTACIVIPRNVKSIRGSAFYYCTGLTVLLPDTVETIETGAFTGCSAVYTTAKAGEIPAGWYLSSDQKKYPDWASETPVIYNCTFGEENGTVYLEQLKVTCFETADGEQKMSLPAAIPVPTRAGYTFVGFATEKGGEAVYLAKDGLVLTDEERKTLIPGTVLYAVWVPAE